METTTVTVRLLTPTLEHAPLLAQICYDAFGTLQDRHGVERDFESIEMARHVMEMLLSRPDFFGVAAEVDGHIVGSNFLQLSDEVCAVGPITIKPGAQSRGVGRALMRAVMDEARRLGRVQVRLQQEAINTASLSLYTKLGFVWREACALIVASPDADADPAVRPAGVRDLEAIERLSRRSYHASRRNEIAAAISAGFPVVVLERGGEVTGYHMPGFFGHGFAANNDDMLTLIGQSLRMAPPPFHKMLVPLSQHDLHARLLSRGARTVKLFNYMTLGEYRTPAGAWIPSIGC